MSNQNAYEIRLGVLHEAKNIAFEAWHEKCIEVRENAKLIVAEGYKLPAAPTAEDVLKIANQLYSFVGGVGSAMERKK